MNLEEALKIGREIPQGYWLDMSPLDRYEEALRILTEHIDAGNDKRKERD